MSKQEELEKLKARRADLEAESLSLKEEGEKLEYGVKVLEEKFMIQKLSDDNEVTKSTIFQLETKINGLEKKLKQY